MATAVRVRPLTGKQVSRILERARKLMNNGGEHWVKKEYQCDISPENSKKKIFAYCARGAVRQATIDLYPNRPVIQTDPYDGFTWNMGTDEWESESDDDTVILAPLRKVIGRKAVEAWNDAKTRTWVQVDDAFKRAAELAKETN